MHTVTLTGSYHPLYAHVDPLCSCRVWLAYNKKPGDILRYRESYLAPPQFESLALRGKMAFYTLLQSPNTLLGTQHTTLPHILAQMIPIKAL